MSIGSPTVRNTLAPSGPARSRHSPRIPADGRSYRAYGRGYTYTRGNYSSNLQTARKLKPKLHPITYVQQLAMARMASAAAAAMPMQTAQTHNLSRQGWVNIPGQGPGGELHAKCDNLGPGAGYPISHYQVVIDGFGSQTSNCAIASVNTQSSWKAVPYVNTPTDPGVRFARQYNFGTWGWAKLDTHYSFTNVPYSAGGGYLSLRHMPSRAYARHSNASTPRSRSHGRNKDPYETNTSGRPPRNTQEVKGRVSAAGKVALAFVRAGTEFYEWVDIVSNAAGYAGVRRKRALEEGKTTGIRDRLDFLFKEGQIANIDYLQLTHLIAANIVEDAVIGRFGRGVAKVNASSRRPVGLAAGPTL